MILAEHELSDIAVTVTMVDGSFDPLHDGHIEYFRQARSLGLPVLCNIAPDSWTSTKHSILLEQGKRAVVLDAIRFIDYVSISQTSTADILEKVHPKIYAKGKDWQERGGIPQLELDVCARLQIEVVYLDTVLNSSSELLRKVGGVRK